MLPHRLLEIELSKRGVLADPLVRRTFLRVRDKISEWAL